MINTYGPDADTSTGHEGTAYVREYPADETRIFLPVANVRERDISFVLARCLCFNRLSPCRRGLQAACQAFEVHSNRVSPVISWPRAPCNWIRPFQPIFVSACKFDETLETRELFTEPATTACRRCWPRINWVRSEFFAREPWVQSESSRDYWWFDPKIGLIEPRVLSLFSLTLFCGQLIKRRNKCAGWQVQIWKQTIIYILKIQIFRKYLDKIEQPCIEKYIVHDVL